MSRVGKKPILIPEEYLDPLYDDLNTPGYIANLHKLYEKFLIEILIDVIANGIKNKKAKKPNVIKGLL